LFQLIGSEKFFVSLSVSVNKNITVPNCSVEEHDFDMYCLYSSCTVLSAMRTLCCRCRLPSVVLRRQVLKVPECVRQNLYRKHWSTCHCCRFHASNAFSISLKLQASVIFIMVARDTEIILLH